jgi:hypothetical protein
MTPRRPDLLAYVHFRAINCRCQRSNVSGVAIVAISRKVARPTRCARAANRPRSASVSRSRRRAQLTSEKSVLLSQVGNGLPLPALKPAGQHPQHDLQHGNIDHDARAYITGRRRRRPSCGTQRDYSITTSAPHERSHNSRRTVRSSGGTLRPRIPTYVRIAALSAAVYDKVGERILRPELTYVRAPPPIRTPQGAPPLRTSRAGRAEGSYRTDFTGTTSTRADARIVSLFARIHAPAPLTQRRCFPSSTTNQDPAHRSTP